MGKSNEISVQSSKEMSANVPKRQPLCKKIQRKYGQKTVLRNPRQAFLVRLAAPPLLAKCSNEKEVAAGTENAVTPMANYPPVLAQPTQTTKLGPRSFVDAIFFFNAQRPLI